MRYFINISNEKIILITKPLNFHILISLKLEKNFVSLQIF